MFRASFPNFHGMLKEWDFGHCPTNLQYGHRVLVEGWAFCVMPITTGYVACGVKGYLVHGE